ncbi:MAG: class I SAM-dependent methyltransferase [Bauldia sp.]
MTRESIGLDERLNDYVVGCGNREHPVAAELRQLTGRMPLAIMQISPEQGQFLALLGKLVGARKALEVGTFCGYSALWIALALPADGRLIACDVSREWTSIGLRHWREAGVAHKIDLRLAPAIETLTALEAAGEAGQFDFAFIDADKEGYDEYYERALRLVRSGGVIVLDNMLWGGMVADPKATDGETRYIRALNAKIAADDRVDKVLVPIGDGMIVARKV